MDRRKRTTLSAGRMSNLNDLEITLKFGYTLKRMNLVKKYNVDWMNIEASHKTLKNRSVNDLEHQYVLNGGSNEERKIKL